MHILILVVTGTIIRNNLKFKVKVEHVVVYQKLRSVMSFNMAIHTEQRLKEAYIWITFKEAKEPWIESPSQSSFIENIFIEFS